MLKCSVGENDSGKSMVAKSHFCLQHQMHELLEPAHVRKCGASRKFRKFMNLNKFEARLKFSKYQLPYHYGKLSQSDGKKMVLIKSEKLFAFWSTLMYPIYLTAKQSFSLSLTGHWHAAFTSNAPS